MTPTTPSAPDEVVLANCPFCDGNAMWNPKEVATGRYDDSLGFVDCTVCGVRTEGRSSREVATRAWNRRASPQPAGVTEDRDSIRILRQFARMYRSGAQGASMEADDAMSLALAVDDVLSTLEAARLPSPTDTRERVLTGAEYEAIHNAGIDAYEAATPKDYRYSATALRKAIDAARAVEAASALTAAEARAVEAAKERDEATAWRIRLQHALMFWMPGVREATDTGLDRSAGDDAYLLIDFRGDAPSACWGDDILARAEAAEAKIAELEHRSLAEGWRPTAVASAWSAIAAERSRQIGVEGWTTDHDDLHNEGEMLSAAVAYLWHGTTYGTSDGAMPGNWPWGAEWWKPKDRYNNLVRAGALCLAERERLARAGRHTGPADHKLGIALRELSALPQPPEAK